VHLVLDVGATEDGATHAATRGGYDDAAALIRVIIDGMSVYIL
jgi:hypothetical protein